MIISYSLFSENLQQEQNVDLSLDNSVELNSILRKEIVFITHGFISDGEEPWLKDLAEAYLNQVRLMILRVRDTKFN